MAACAVAGCETLSQPYFHLIESPFNRSEARIRALPQNSTPLRIVREELPPQMALAPFTDSSPASEGNKLLRDEVILDSSVLAVLKSNGVPDAVELNRSRDARTDRWFAMYYKGPPETLAYATSLRNFNASGPRYHGTRACDLPQVPRSVWRLALGEGPLAPPWPVTIPVAARAPFGVPLQGPPAPAKANGEGWARLARGVASTMEIGTGDDARRTREAIKRLAQANRADGLNWTAVLFNSRVASGFGVPDGTLFVSTSLVEKLNDNQLAAVLAHLMGHERYQHYPHNLTVGEQVGYTRNVGRNY